MILTAYLQKHRIRIGNKNIKPPIPINTLGAYIGDFRKIIGPMMKNIDANKIKTTSKNFVFLFSSLLITFKTMTIKEMISAKNSE